MRQASILGRLGALKTKFDEDGPVKQLVLEHVTITPDDQAALEKMSREDVRVFIVPFQLSIADVERLIDSMQADLERRRQDQWAATEAVDNARAKEEGEKQLNLDDVPAPEPNEGPGPDEDEDDGDLAEALAADEGEGDPDLVPGDPRYYCLECKKRVDFSEVGVEADAAGKFQFTHSVATGGCGGIVFAAEPGAAAPEGVTEEEADDAGTDERANAAEEFEASDDGGPEAVV